MQIKEFIREFEDKSTIQKQEHLIKFLDKNIEMNCGIMDIEDNEINLRFGQLFWENEDDGFRDYIGDHNFVKLNYERVKFLTQLLEFSPGDDIKIIAKLKGANFYSIDNHFEFDLISITKVSTYNSRIAARKKHVLLLPFVTETLTHQQ